MIYLFTENHNHTHNTYLYHYFIKDNVYYFITFRNNVYMDTLKIEFHFDGGYYLQTKTITQCEYELPESLNIIHTNEDYLTDQILYDILNNYKTLKIIEKL